MHSLIKHFYVAVFKKYKNTKSILKSEKTLCLVPKFYIQKCDGMQNCCDQIWNQHTKIKRNASFLV
jgi:hypothetical protein